MRLYLRKRDELKTYKKRFAFNRTLVIIATSHFILEPPKNKLSCFRGIE
jgi:hypothetical protein